MSTETSHHKETQGGGDYQRLRTLLDEPVLRKAQTNNGAVSGAPLGDHESPKFTPDYGQFQGRPPFQIPIRNRRSARVPWVASAFPYTQPSYTYPDSAPYEIQNRNVFPGRLPLVAPTLSYMQRSLTYPDQGTTNHVQRLIFFGPGVKPRNLICPSICTPWTSTDPRWWQPAGSCVRQGPWNEHAAKTWNNSAAAGFVLRRRLPYPNLPLKHRIHGFVRDANLAPIRSPSFAGSHFSSLCTTATSNGQVLSYHGPNNHVDHIPDAGDIDELGIMSAPTLADRSDERYQYFPERGVRSRSSPPRSRSQLRPSIRNRRSQSLPPRRISQ